MQTCGRTHHARPHAGNVLFCTSLLLFSGGHYLASRRTPKAAPHADNARGYILRCPLALQSLALAAKILAGNVQNLLFSPSLQGLSPVVRCLQGFSAALLSLYNIQAPCLSNPFGSLPFTSHCESHHKCAMHHITNDTVHHITPCFIASQLSPLDPRSPLADSFSHNPQPSQPAHKSVEKCLPRAAA